MRTDAHTSRLARWVTVTAILTLMGGCKKDEPAPAAASSPDVTLPSAEKPQAPMPPVPLAETFVLSDVTFRYVEAKSLLYVSYRVSSRSPRRERIHLCADFIDKDGFFVEDEHLIDWFSLRSGDSEEVVDDVSFVYPDAWNATEVLRFQVRGGNCLKSVDGPRSNVVVLAKSGLPPPPGTLVEGKSPGVEAADAPSPLFRLEDVRMRQNAEGEVWADYRLTNLTKGRATSKLCARLVDDTACTCQGIDEAGSVMFTLDFGASERRSTLLNLKNNENWGRGQHLVFYTAHAGCANAPEAATSNVVTLAKPRSIEAPEPLDEELGEGEEPWEP